MSVGGAGGRFSKGGDLAVGNEMGRLAAGGSKPLELIRIFDEEGNDVTPLPLTPSAVGSSVAGSATGPFTASPVVLGNGKVLGATTSVNMNAADLSIMMRSSNDLMASAMSKMQSQTLGSFAGGGSIFRSSASEDPQQSRTTSQSRMSTSEDAFNTHASSANDFNASASESGLRNLNKLEPLDVVLRQQYPGFVPPKELAPLNLNKPLTEKELQKQVSVILKETDYISLFDMPSVTASNERGEEYERVERENSAYLAKKTFYASGKNQSNHSSQTYYLPSKNKDVQVSQPKTASTATVVTSWMIADAEEELRTRQAIANQQQNPEMETVDDVDGVGQGNGGLHDNSDSQNAIAASIDGASAMLFSSTSLKDMSLNENADDRVSGSSITELSIDASASMASQTDMQSSQHDGFPTQNSSISRLTQSQANATAEGPFGAAGKAASKVNSEAFYAAHSISLEASLNVMERAILGNNNAERLLTFRNAVAQSTSGTDSASADKDNGVHADSAAAELAAVQFSVSSIRLLWSFRCELTRGRPVSAICWNPRSKDVVAIAYGASRVSTASSPGLVLCWSVQNPEWPERVYSTNAPVTCLKFSLFNPCLLAIGMKDGNMCVYDVRHKDNKPSIDLSGIGGNLLDSSGAIKRNALDSATGPGVASDTFDRQATGKHRDAVWDILWVNTNSSASSLKHGGVDDGSANSPGLLHSEAIVSISTDGRVLQHQIKMNVEHVELVFLKPYVGKIPKSGVAFSQGEEKPMSKNTLLKQGAGSVLSRSVGGLCIDFSPTDNSVYLVGTEEGHIHLCSTTYNEQYLSTFVGHTGPVYKVKWNKFRPSVFMSCSNDWTVRIWDQKKEEALIKLQNGKDAISDICWSQEIATLFATTSVDGTLEIWDLSYSVLDPFVSYTALDRSLTTVLFAPDDTSIILVGDDNGLVDVYKIRKMPNTVKDKTDSEQGAALYECLQSTHLSR